jgi:hypothetical protein
MMSNSDPAQIRRRLPQRRSHELVDFEHAGHHYTAGLGYFDTGELGEIFINVPGRSGSAIEAVARDAGGPLGAVLDLLASV